MNPYKFTKEKKCIIYTCVCRLSRFNCWVYCFDFFFRLVFFIFFASMNLIFYPCWMSVSVCIVCACACAYAVGNCVNANFFFQYFSHKCFYSAMYCWNDTVKPRWGYKRDRNNVLMSQTNTRTLIEPAMSTMVVVPMLLF